jgi:UDP-N-acetylmuramoyl-L-alanyl-D-glutamate--2,6-diaminopimelate ligase
VRLDLLLAGADLAAAGLVLDVRGDPGGVDVSSMAYDSRLVVPGSLFCCIPGLHVDGHDFAGDAAERGAVAVLAERPLPLPAGTVQLVVASVRAAMGPVASALHGHPSRSLTVVGVTGTNGKTTTTHLLASILSADGCPTEALGTLSGARTTPEAPDLQARLAELRDGGTKAVAMEVSSHALDQHRVDAVHFRAAVFTNLSQDHLDYHRTMAAYFAAKARLFEAGRTDAAVVNADDEWGRRLLGLLRGRGINVRSFSLADVSDLVVKPEVSRFRWHDSDVTLHLGGRFNVENALAAATAAAELGVRDATIAEGLASVESVRGRFERVDAGQPFLVIVDYAHTPDGLERALAAARELAGGRVIVVFGAGGERDHAKRPLMGEAATRLADLVVLTSDNPRSEEPDAIIAEVAAGARRTANGSGAGAVPNPAPAGELVLEPDRARAIERAITAAGAGDVVLIAGKGHETGQEIAGRVVPFDDALKAREVIGRITPGGAP